VAIGADIGVGATIGAGIGAGATIGAGGAVAQAASTKVAPERPARARRIINSP
jgi:hypothetical protein